MEPDGINKCHLSYFIYMLPISHTHMDWIGFGNLDPRPTLISRQNPFSASKAVALTFALTRVSCYDLNLYPYMFSVPYISVILLML